MNKNELMSKTAKELLEIAKGYNISGRWDMNKNQLAEAIIGAESLKNSNSDSDNVNSANDENVIDANNNCNCVGEQENKCEKNSSTNSDKMKYINNIKKGTIVAFKVNVFGNERVKSAAVENVSFKRGVLKLVTKYGAEYIVPFSDVVWVRTNTRWPRGVYELLKGVNKREEK